MIPCGAPRMSVPAKSPLPILFLTVFVDLLGFGLVIPTLPLYAKSFGASPTVITLLSASFSLMQLICAPLWGRLSDRVGRRPVLALTAFGAAIAYVIFGLGTALWVLFVARAAAGAFGGSISAAQAYIADVTTPETRGRGMAVIGAAFGLGFTIGPALGGLAAHGFGPTAPYFIAAGLALVNGVWILAALPEPARHAHRPPRGLASYADALRTPRLAFYILIFFFVTYAFAHVESAFVLFTADRLGFGERENGLSFMLIGLTLTVMQGGVVRPLIARHGPVRLIVVGTIICAVGTALTPAAASWWHVIPICVLTACGNALYTPSLTTALSLATPGDRQGEMLGVAQSASALGRVVGPASAGLLFQYAGPAWPFVLSAAVLFVIGLVIAPRAKTDQAALGS